MMNATLLPDIDIKAQTTLASQTLRPETLQTLYRQYQPLVLKICNRYTKNREEAEDLAQDVFIKVNGSFRGFAGHAQPSTWLYRVTVNHCLDHLRWKKRQVELYAAYGDELQGNQMRDSGLDHPAKRLFNRLLEGLDEANRQVVFLRFEVGLTHEEIAEICGVSRVAITKRLAKFQAKIQSLKDELQECLEAEGDSTFARQTCDANEDED